MIVDQDDPGAQQLTAVADGTREPSAAPPPDAAPAGTRRSRGRHVTEDDVPLGRLRQSRRARRGPRRDLRLQHPRDPDRGPDRAVHSGQPGPGRPPAEPLGCAARLGRRGDPPDHDRHRGGLPGFGHPVDGPPVPGADPRLSRLREDPPGTIPELPQDQRPVSPDHQDRGPAGQPPREGQHRGDHRHPPPVRRAVLHADRGGPDHLLHGRPPPAAAVGRTAVPEGAPRGGGQDHRRDGGQGWRLHDRQPGDLPLRRARDVRHASPRWGCRSPCRWASRWACST